MNSRNSAVSKYLEAKQNRRRQAKYRQKRLNMGLPAAVPLKPVSLNQEEKEEIASTEAIGTAKQKKFFVTRHFGWPVSLGVHAFAGFLLTIYAVTEYIPEEPPVSLDFMEPVRQQRRIKTPKIRSVKPPDSVRIRAPRIQRTRPEAVEIPREQAQFHTPTDDLMDVGGPPSGGVALPEGIATVHVEQTAVKIPTESIGPKISRETQFAPEDTEINIADTGDLGDRTIEAEVQVQVDQRPRTLRKIDPKYPEPARRAGREGLVQVQFVVGVNGRATDITIIKEEPKGFGFGANAIEAVKKTPFAPAKKDGENVAMRVKIPIRFTLDED